MLDLSRITEAITGLLGNVAENGAGSLMDAIGNSGLGLEQLEGLAPDQVMNLLSNYGVDLADFSPEQIEALLAQLGIDGGRN